MKAAVIYFENNISSDYRDKLKKAGIKLWGENRLQIWKITSSDDSADKDEEINYQVCINLPEHHNRNNINEILAAVEEVCEKEKPKMLILPDDNMGNIIAGKISKRAGKTACSHLVDCCFDEEGYFHGQSLSYNGNLIASVKYHDLPLAVTISPAASFEDEKEPDKKECFVTNPPVIYDFRNLSSQSCDCMKIVKSQEIPQKDDLNNAEIVFVCGRGAGPQNVARMIGEIAKEAGGMTGGSRPAVIEGLADPSALIGISGKMIAPRFCLLWGVSGSGAFMTGVKNAKVIIAVNRDEGAPVFKGSDYGIVADCEELASEIKSRYEREDEQIV